MRMMRARIQLALALMMLACANAIQAENWPRFRGPKGRGSNDEADFPAQWSEQDRAWGVKLGGSGHSSPVVWDELVFVTLVRPDAVEVGLAAIQVADGKVRWRKPYTLRGRTVPYVPTPLAKDKWLFAVHDSGLISCLDTATGKTLWSEKPGGRFYSSPVCARDKLFCVNRDGQVLVLNASDSYELLAINDLGESSYATPAIANGRLFVRTLSHLTCIKSR